MPLAVDMTELPASVRAHMHKVLTEEHSVEIMQAKLRQRRMAQFYHNHEARSIDGIGGQTMAIDPYWVGYFNMKYGRDSMGDPEFKQWLLKEEEMFRVKSKGTKIQVGYAPARATFTKKYGAG